MPDRAWWESLNVDFKEDPVGDRPNLAGAHLVGGVSVLAMVVTGNDGNSHPALMYRFVDASGVTMEPIVFVADDNTMKAMDKLTNRSVATAIRHAKLRRRKR